MFRKLLAGLLTGIMVGCAAVPESLQTTTDHPLTDITALHQQGTQAVGQEVRLGGMIAAIRNDATETRLEIVAMPIGRDGKPKPDQALQQRFAAYVSGFLEPMQYQTGRLITVAGRVSGTESGQVGDYPYLYPVVKASGVQLWQVKQEVWLDDFDRFSHCVGAYCPPVWIRDGYTRGEIRERVTH